MTLIDAVLWAIVVVGAIGAIAGAAYGTRLRKQVKIHLGVPQFLVLLVTGFIIQVLWIWLAFLTDYYQFLVMVIAAWVVQLSAHYMVKDEESSAE